MAVVATLCAPRVPVAGLAGRGTAPLGARKSSRSCRARQPCLVYAAKGFGQKTEAVDTGKKGEDGSTPVLEKIPFGWKAVGTMEDFPDNRDTLPVFVNDVPYMVFRVDDKLYCTDAQSTAYQYPLTDAKISNSGPDGPTIKVPLDGTVYKLESGEVLEWCPADNPLRGVLGMLKKDQPRVDLRTYKVELTERGTIIINVSL
mmetsp:Transcript_7162/g.26334  ORF Transcript_7162/g.26334 Transcript_7162/m.26334 type:complete len:201 (-) Transcript_7162:112-714(-)